ncbi:MAG: hypothetical protein KDC05_04995 [Bacteroidales bacterium]|nr:hypothetical protein [Bacteroidales bacterium]
MIKKDFYFFGFVMGVLSPVVIFGILWILNLMLFKIGVAKFYLDKETHILLSLTGNLALIRYYFVNLGYDKTGRGILLITFAFILLFFALKDYFLQYI